MDARTLVTLLAAGRVAVGTAAFLAPQKFASGWIGTSAAQPGVSVAVRAYAVRDLALGVGTLAALGDPTRSRAWLEAGILSDSGDAAATIMARRELPRLTSLAVFGVAVGAAWIGAMARAGIAGGDGAA